MNLSRSIELDPNYTDAWKKKASALIILDRYDEAVESFNKVLEIDASDLQASFWLANTFCLMREPEKAIRCLDKILEISPST
ncbi:MAG: tetratricopeptide repeat protein [Nitrososphaeraceae archaeon]